MSEEKSIIDEELAKKFLDDPDNVDLSKATEIADEAAELLSKHEEELNLRNLKRIPLPIAKQVARSSSSIDTEMCPDFDNLDELDVETAQTLAQGQFYMLTFNFFKFTPHLDVFRALSNQRGYIGYTLLALSSSVAEVLATYKGELSLPNLEAMSDSAAECLSKFRGKILYVEALEQNPSVETATSLLKVPSLDEELRNELRTLVEDDEDDY